MSDNEKIREQIHELIDIAFDTNGFEARTRGKTGTLPTIFFEYSGHVNAFRMAMHSDGWQSGSIATTLFEGWIDKPIQDERIEAIRERCRYALTNKKESEVLENDIANKMQKIADDRQIVKNMRKRLKKLQKEGR